MSGDGRCRNGHTMDADHAFCPQCGAVRADAAEAGNLAAAPESEPPAAPAPVLGVTSVGQTENVRLGRRLALGVVVGLAGLTWFAVRASATHTLAGTMELTDSDGYSVTGYNACAGNGGYDDIDMGALVVVRDASGQTIATSDLGWGRERDGACRFDFEVPDVPKADFYEIEISHRGGLSYSYDEMEALGWDVAFSLG